MSYHRSPWKTFLVKEQKGKGKRRDVLITDGNPNVYQEAAALYWA